MADRKNASLAHFDTDETDSWDNVAMPAQRPSSHVGDGTSKANGTRTYEDSDAKDIALRQELASVRKVNEAIEGVIHSLQQAQNNMKVNRIPTRMIIELTIVRLSTRQSEPHLPYLTLGHVFCLRPNTISA
jgi:hypothetical protein